MLNYQMVYQSFNPAPQQEIPGAKQLMSSVAPSEMSWTRHPAEMGSASKFMFSP